VSEITFGIFDFFILLGCFQGLLIACVFIFNKKFQKRTNYILAISLISLALLGVNQVIYNLNLKATYPIIKYLPIRYTILCGIILYYYILFTIKVEHKYNKRDSLIISFFLFFFLLDLVLFGIYLYSPEFVLAYNEVHNIYLKIKELTSVFFSFIVLLWGFRKLHLLDREDTLTSKETNRLLWLRNNTIAVFIVWAVWAIPETYSVFSGKTFWWTYYPTCIGLITLIFWLGFYVILKREYFIAPPPNILSEKTETHYKNLLRLMQTEKLYKNPNLTLDLLAQKTHLSKGYLSQIINQKSNKKFSEFINIYRIAEVKENLADPKYAHYSILGIGLEAGFKSKSTFNAAFKKVTGQTPSAFKKKQQRL